MLWNIWILINLIFGLKIILWMILNLIMMVLSFLKMIIIINQLVLLLLFLKTTEILTFLNTKNLWISLGPMLIKKFIRLLIVLIIILVFLFILALNVMKLFSLITPVKVSFALLVVLKLKKLKQNIFLKSALMLNIDILLLLFLVLMSLLF